MSAALLTILNTVLPAVLTIVGTVLATFLIKVAAVAQARWGIEIEAKDREALHSALMSGIRAALQRGLGPGDAVIAALAHAQRSVPDALARLNPSDKVLGNIAEAKLEEAIRAAVK